MDRGVGVGVGEALALEVQAPFARLLVDGEKSIDVRGYALSTAKLTPNARVYVLETTRGTPGKSVLADAWTKGGFNPRSRADVARRLREPWFGGDDSVSGRHAGRVDGKNNRMGRVRWCGGKVRVGGGVREGCGQTFGRRRGVGVSSGVDAGLRRSDALRLARHRVRRRGRERIGIV